MSKRIIVQGDDWGYTQEISDGIEYAYEHGILTETAVMVNVLDRKKKSEYRSRIDNLENKSGLRKPKLGIGVHLNVTYGTPLSPKWPNKEFTRPYKGSGKPEEWTGSAWTEYFSQFSSTQVEDEYRRQIELALEIFGQVDHLDSHHFSASYEPLKTVYEKLAKEYQLAVRTDAPLSENPVYGGNYVVKREASIGLKAKGIRTADKYILKLFFNEKKPVQSFLREMDKTKDKESVEVMFHPGKGEKTDDWRKTDLEILTNEEVLKYFSNSNIKLITYGDL
jgi:predicted glycoside hydrolase/deacetylase ChbG (UPF0249 family)